MNSLLIETVWKGPNFSIASGGACRPMAEMPKITMGIEGGMTIPSPPALAVTAAP